jgi:FkbM family methyltransferase
VRLSFTRALSAPLRLPSGRITEIVGDRRDVSVVEHLHYTRGHWEPHVVAVLERLVQPDWTCLDVGANIGAHTLVLAELAAEVVAFEANPAAYRYLLRNVRDCANVSVVQGAVWDEEGFVNIAASREFAGCGFVTSDASLDGSDAGLVIGGRQISFTFRVHRVPTVRLDDWAEGRERINLIKIDVEGAEERVLAGAQEMLARHRPILVTEYSPGAAQTVGADPHAYLRALQDLYGSISAIEPDGSLSPIGNSSELETRIAAGRGWEDLVCMDLR